MDGAIEILSNNATMSEGWRIAPASVEDIPAALTTLRGLTDFRAVPIPDGPPLPDDPAWSRRVGADAVWEANDRDGRAVEVLWREDHEVPIPPHIVEAIEQAREDLEDG